MTSGNSKVTRRRGKRRGSAVLEMALTVTLLLNLTFGMVEFGYYFYVKNAFEGAARQGARAAIIPGGTASTTSTAVSTALAVYNFSANSVTTTITYPSGTSYSDPSGAPLGTAIEVNVSATWGVIGAGFRPLALIGASKVVSGYCVINKE